MADDHEDCGGKDVMTLGPILEDGARPYVRHRPGCGIETGFAKPAVDGQPVGLSDSVIQLDHESNGIYNVKTLYERPRTTDGPPQVSTEAFRSGWDRIFSTKQTVGQA